MNTEKLQEVLAWIKGTDLVEVSYKRGTEGFSLATAEGAPASIPIPRARYAPVCAPAVGVFQWNEPGKARGAEEGEAACEGQLLAVIETGKGRWAKVTAPCSGRLAKAFVEAGAAVEYGQPLFFIEAA